MNLFNFGVLINLFVRILGDEPKSALESAMAATLAAIEMPNSPGNL